LLATTEHLDFTALSGEGRRRVYRLEPSQLADYLRSRLGRPLVAYLTQTEDVKSVTRWAQGKQIPERSRLHRMRIAYQIYFVLEKVFGNDDSAADWFTGHSALRPEMPADLIRNDRFHEAFIAASQSV
jgi:hypothetical protein